MATQLFITVDTEVCAYDPARDNPDTQIWGRTLDGNEYGISFIMDALARHGWFCTFFLNVYDTDLWGEESCAAAARAIVSRGFDVQLHTHVPKGMSAYPVDRQHEFIREGVDRLQRWTGIRPVWHRAGNLTANADTLKACAAAGLTGDSSFLYGWPQCADLGAGSDPGAGTRTTKAFAEARNRIRCADGVLELPITTFRTLPLVRNYRHLDVDACTGRELTSVVRQAVRLGVPRLVLLMHSFSFVRRTEAGYMPNEETIGTFRRFLGDLEATAGVEVVAVAALTPTLSPEGRGSFAVPSPWRGEGAGEGDGSGDLHSGLVLTYHRAWSHWARNWKNKFVALAPLLLAAGILMWLAWNAMRCADGPCETP